MAGRTLPSGNTFQHVLDKQKAASALAASKTGPTILDKIRTFLENRSYGRILMVAGAGGVVLAAWLVYSSISKEDETAPTTQLKTAAVDESKVSSSGNNNEIEDKKKTRVAFSDEGSATSDDTEAESDTNENPIIRSVHLASPRDNVLILKQCPRGRKTPCIAPFPLKLETFLRVHRIKYELDFDGHEAKLYGSPWIRFNTEDVAESQNVIQFLIDTYDIKVEKELSGEQRAMTTAYTHLLENHLYWGIALWRWVYDGARSLKEIQLLPLQTRRLIPEVCKTVEQAAWFHGIGKLNPPEVQKAVIKDLGSLSEYLGDKDYFLNTKTPTELDCTAFGMLSQFLWNMNGPFHDAVADKFKNLREFCWRMRLNYWPDWEECLNNAEFYSDEPYPTADFVDTPLSD